MSGRRSRSSERVPAHEIEQNAIRIALDQGIDPRWVTLLERVLADLRGLGPAGERLLQWCVREFWHGRIQDWIDEEGATDEQVAARLIDAAHALEALKQRHQPLPDWRGFTFRELLDWSATGAPVRDDDDRAPPVWRERNVVYRFEDGWTLERIMHYDDLMQESRLMHNCAGITQAYIEPVLSLRDPIGRPHLDIKFNLRGEVVEIGAKAEGPVKAAYAARLRRALTDSGRFYYLARDYDNGTNRFLSLIFMRDLWDGPDEFGIYDPRRKKGLHA
jgi:hypothetical protein